MHTSVISLLCFGLVLESCLAGDHGQFLRDLQKKLRDELAIGDFDDFIDELQKAESCNSANNSSTCCVKFRLSQDMNVCGIASFEEDTCVNFRVTLNGNVIMADKIKGADPPPICKGFQQGYNACVLFEKVTVDLKGHTFSGCASIQLKKESKFVKRFQLGCFELSPKWKYRLLENKSIGTS
ncbi:uncharacterized protein LOC110457394 [Mizuhopecten yessoensis]|uniref:DUF4773 domain-containing protein n=1 Tax=Mizuhopecten yessoensis TaxID=6573 RepID=A0A210Q8T3_MIZYE|nr:uncharacterized protein LOC110457394 [Mizuhopecten yessoensis]OWF45160.1 hypothetical protein KP79_PYT24729 [Mizuhopecten yessoensis]